MVGTVTEALKHIQAELATLLDAPTILALCREVGYQWRAAPARSGHHRPSLPLANPPCATPPVVTCPTSRRNALPPPRFVRRAPAYRSSSGSSCCGGHPPSASRQRTTRDDGGGTAPSWSTARVSRCPIPPNSKRTLANPAGSVRGAGFPVAHLLALFHAGTGFLLEVLAAPWHTHDMAEVATLHASAAPRGRARGRSRLLLLCPSGPPAPAGTPCRLSCPSAADCRFHPVSSPYHAPAVGGAEGPAPLPLAPPVGHHGPTRRVGEARAPAGPSPYKGRFFEN